MIDRLRVRLEARHCDDIDQDTCCWQAQQHASQLSRARLSSFLDLSSGLPTITLGHLNQRLTTNPRTVKISCPIKVLYLALDELRKQGYGISARQNALTLPDVAKPASKVFNWSALEI